MNETIIKQLKKLKAIEPDANFASMSRRSILAMKTESRMPFWKVNFRMVAGLSGAVAALAAWVFLFSGPSASTAFASPELLNQEFTNMNINVEVQQIDYRQNVNKTITSAISEISSNKLSHLNQEVLNSEVGSFSSDATGTDPQIDQLLDKVIQ